MAGSIKKGKSFKEHKLSLPKEGSAKAEKWFAKREAEIRKKQIKNELLKQGVDTRQKSNYIIKEGIPYKIIDGKLVALKRI